MIEAMRIKSIAGHLRPYIMLARRRTTINHAFAAAIAPSDTYDAERVSEAMRVLGLDPESDLSCAYCDEPAETWDHVFATVKNSRFSGHGHRLGNLLPCCKPCNSRKGNTPWEAHLASVAMTDDVRERRIEVIRTYLERYACVDEPAETSADHERLDRIRHDILALMEEGDRVAARIRASAPRRGDRP